MFYYAFTLQTLCTIVLSYQITLRAAWFKLYPK